MWISRELSVDVRSPGGKMAADVHPMHTADDGGDVPGGCCCRTPSHEEAGHLCVSKFPSWSTMLAWSSCPATCLRSVRVMLFLSQFLLSAMSARYSLTCQPVDYSRHPDALRMARACWLYYVSKYALLADTVFFILRKKNGQITFLHVYHHATMVINWWLGVAYVAGGQCEKATSGMKAVDSHELHSVNRDTVLLSGEQSLFWSRVSVPKRSSPTDGIRCLKVAKGQVVFP
ncbi:hypothetical protein C0Q70_17131 [Pomacea canaliculata]|uniref:Elongation of very long chain fatty acids protein n=1 Tax=Pomacea canaliculata TaxID=400727 RepID=A0A2T7NRR0_POMCA|nr:hypothetical protein C0Q70_17131 [Pomacea canaliculata]